MPLMPARLLVQQSGPILETISLQFFDKFAAAWDAEIRAWVSGLATGEIPVVRMRKETPPHNWLMWLLIKVVVSRHLLADCSSKL